MASFDFLDIDNDQFLATLQDLLVPFAPLDEPVLDFAGFDFDLQVDNAFPVDDALLEAYEPDFLAQPVSAPVERAEASECKPTSLFQDHSELGSGESAGVSPLTPSSVHTLPESELQRKKRKLAAVTKRASHNIIEKKYRSNIRTKIKDLQDAVPTLRALSVETIPRLDGLEPATKLNKALVLLKATEYIKHMEQKNARMEEQIRLLQQRVQLGAGFYESFNTTHTPPESARFRQTFEALRDSSSHAGRNMVLGGMAVLGALYMLSNEFRGLAIMPLGPSFALALAPAGRLLYVLGAGLVLFGVYLACRLFSASKKAQRGPWATWAMVNAGLVAPGTLLPEAVERIHGRLVGTVQLLLGDWVREYVLVSASAVTFENRLLCVLIGIVLTERWRWSRVLLRGALNVNGSLLANLSYRGLNGDLQRVRRLLAHDPAALSLPQVRLQLVALPKGEHNSGALCAELYLRHRHNVYASVFAWRVHELLTQGVAAVLDAKLGKGETQRWVLDQVLEGEPWTPLKQQYWAVKTLRREPSRLAEEYAVFLGHSLLQLDTYLEGPELSDESDGEESQETESQDTETAEETGTGRELHPLALMRKHRLSLAPTNLVNVDVYIALASGVLLARLDEGTAWRLVLPRMRLAAPVKLDFASFALLLEVVLRCSNEQLSQSELSVLESMVRAMRQWLDESACMEPLYRSELLGLVLDKGVCLLDA